MSERGFAAAQDPDDEGAAAVDGPVRPVGADELARLAVDQEVTVVDVQEHRNEGLVVEGEGSAPGAG